MNNGYTFDQFMQAAIGADQAQNSAAFYQPPPQFNATAVLSPFAPTFTPSMPSPPNLNSAHSHGGLSQQWTNLPQEFYRTNPPPSHDYVAGIHNFGVAQSESQVSHKFVAPPSPQGSQDFGAFQQQRPTQRGSQSYQYYGGHRGRGRGQGGQRGRGRGGLDPFQYQMATRGHLTNSQQFTNNAGQRPRQQQSRVKERHSRNDYGDPLYSHADLDNNSHRNNDNRVHDSQAPGAMGNSMSNARNMYVRKVDQYNGRLNGSSQNAPRSDDYTITNFGARGGHRRDPNERSQQDHAGHISASPHSQHDSRNRSSMRSAPGGRRGMNGIADTDTDGENQGEEGGNRRGKYISHHIYYIIY